MRTAAIFLLAGGFLGQGNLFGQRILYNKDLDDKGKALSAIGKKLTSSATTEKELQNLAVLEKAQIDRILSGAMIVLRRNVESLGKWETVPGLVQSIEDGIKTVDLSTIEAKDLKAQRDEVDTQIAALRTSLDRLKGVSKEPPPSLAPAIQLLGDVKDLTNFVDGLASTPVTKDTSTAIQSVIDGLKELQAIIDTVSNIWATAKAASVDPRSLAPSVEETQLAVLTVETQYLKEITLLRARQKLDNGELRKIFTELQKEITAVGAAPGNQIRGDLFDVAHQMNPAADFDQLRRQMRDKVHILFLAASASAQNTIAADIEGVRETLAWRRYQIRTAAIYNGTYEIALQAASDRLSAYYAAGLKPSQIAQLLHDLTAAVSLPKIAF